MIERDTSKFSLVLVLRDNPGWSLTDLFARMKHKDRHAAMLRELTISDLATPPPIGPIRLEIARRTTGPAFDELVHRVVRASTHPVKACELRVRLGGPRWKLQGSLGRLVDAGKIERTGRTAGTRYRAIHS